MARRSTRIPTLPTTMTSVEPPPQPATGAAAEATGAGWYLYGITRAGALLASGVQLPFPALLASAGPVAELTSGDIAALVRQVPLSEFGPDALSARLSDPAWVESMARHHNDVVTAVHQKQAVLPARFGRVYASEADLRATLDTLGDALRAQLDRLQGCDEWAVHLYASLESIEQRVADELALAAEVEQATVGSSPGRAYLLRRKLADDVATAVRQARANLAQAAYDSLMHHARDGHLNPLIPSTAGEAEIGRGAFLVEREQVDDFLSAARGVEVLEAGTRCDVNGPWPPYSFVTVPEAGPA
jgi:hypothetical protein